MRQRLKRRIFKILEITPPEDSISIIFDRFILTLIFLNLVAVSLETVDGIGMQYKYYFRVFEVFSVIFFTVEYLLRVWCCTVYRQFRNPLWGRLRFMLTPFALVDLIAIVPFYLPLLLPDLRFFRSLRLLRFFRLLKMGRHSESFQTIGKVLIIKQKDLIVSLFVLFVSLLFSSSLMYFAEHEAQPEAFSSIPAAMWWGVITLTTVGYGDVYPVTTLGKLLGAALAILGIGIFALPAGILASGFADEIQTKRTPPRQEKQRTCPHCGKAINE
ncbi:MAG: potassium channel protein [Cyanobacteria bacterium QS_7_48_42]|jgi:voltage-gated potassium channel|nr:MAG: potassium channel protein [Cyanobacteria bacterium QS_5_48_63]PSO90521.1 MAG: potassium channel protein [Cyanobacteria bacterium QS_9_48_30]PSO92214.1 MAG: potassium channel protein [Cyanobacteria bacterium QS_6_48_18]PSO94690.1 MAG: potassium channel protein [Cyanobacteria bacterium SW_6_48_11]PSP01114.1 MAG: potassium channel protein [Cyanobacteria bacterium SW_7_48_12]PSP03606.1 MAG: potassium channel protein [Cyanobacteria bacterium SW_12_48_29]PSP05484.1 MAG: potassium channel pr